MQISPFVKSKKTTILGVVLGLIGVLTGFQEFLSGDEIDNLAQLTDNLLVTITGLGFFFSRDADKSSEDSKIKEGV